MFSKFIYGFILCLHLAQTGFSQKLAWKKSINDPFAFEENRGQLSGEKDKPLPEILYSGRQGGVTVYCFRDHLSFVFEKADSVTVQSSRLEMHLLNANPMLSVISEKQIPGHTNYYLPHCPNGILKIHSYQKLIYKDIYPNIDMVLDCISTQANALEYSFIVHPGGKAEDVKIQWTGGENINSATSALLMGGEKNLHKCALGQISESKPKAFLENDPANELICTTVFENNIQGFKTGKYDLSRTIVIDPIIQWGTYYGGRRLDKASAIHVGSKAVIYISGQTSSINAIASSGTFQSSRSDSLYFYSYIAAIDSSGKRLWGTYYGVSNKINSYGGTLASDQFQNVYMSGYSADGGTFYATPGAYKKKGQGNKIEDAFLAKFDSTGKRVWGTYYGGNQFDRIGKVVCDYKGKLFICGGTTSPDSIATKGSYISVKPGVGTNSAFMSCFDTSGHLNWGTYFGGDAKGTGGSRLCLDKKGNLIMAGSTYDSIGIATSGVFQSKPGKNLSYPNPDGYVAKFDSSGKKLIWATYYGGEGQDNITGLGLNAKNEIFISGVTKSTTGISSPVFPKRGPAYIAHLNANGGRTWGKYIESYTSITPTDMTTDSLGNSFICYRDALFANRVDSSGINGWSLLPMDKTKFSEAAGIDHDSAGYMYILGFTLSDSGISTLNGWQPKYGGHNTTGEGDAYLLKIDRVNCPTPVAGGSKIKFTTAPCNGDSLRFGTQKVYGNKYVWKVKGGHISRGQGTDSITVVWDSSGYGYIRVIESSPFGCVDSAEQIMYGNHGLKVDFSYDQPCIGQDAHFKSNITGPYDTRTRFWDFGDGFTDTALNPTHKYKYANSYIIYLRAKKFDCWSYLFKSYLNVWPLPDSGWSLIPIGARTATFYPNDTIKGNQYRWYFGDGDSSILQSPTHKYLKDTTYKVRLVVTDSNSCTSSHDSVIKVLFTGVNGIEQSSYDLNIYPNPFTTITNVSYILQEKSSVAIKIYNLIGEEIGVLEERIKPAGNFTIPFRAPKVQLPPGVYILKMWANDTMIVKRLVKLD